MPCPLLAHRARKPENPVHVLEVTRQPQTDADDAELVSNMLLELLHGDSRVESVHVRAETEKGSCTARVAHAPCAEGDVL